MYDQRLFNRDQGMGHGLQNDESYNLYDKNLFADRGTGLFRPSAAAADDDEAPGGTLLASPFLFKPSCKGLLLSAIPDSAQCGMCLN